MSEQEATLGGLLMALGFFVASITGIVIAFNSSLSYGFLSIGITLFALGWIVHRPTAGG